MSLGGYTAIFTAQKYPDIIGDVFVSGCEKTWSNKGSWKNWTEGLTLTFFAWTFTHLPKTWRNWVIAKSGLQASEELVADMKAVATVRMGQIYVTAMAEDLDPEEKSGWVGRFEATKARTCIVAATLDDKVEACLERGKQLKKANPESRAFKIEGKRHAWDLQDPELFARSIKSWMDREEMPQECLAL